MARNERWWNGRHVEAADVDGLYLGPDGTWSTSPDRDPDGLRHRLAAARRRRGLAA